MFAAAERRLCAAEKLIDLEMTSWHEYRLDWTSFEVVFSADGIELLRSEKPPALPLGFVAWVDNNATTMGPGKDFSFERIAVSQRQWMELAHVRIEKPTGI
jgi:hypothetical protein